MGADPTTPLLHQLWVPWEVAKSQVVLTCMSLMQLPFQRLPGMAGQRSHCTLLQPWRELQRTRQRLRNGRGRGDRQENNGQGDRHKVQRKVEKHWIKRNYRPNNTGYIISYIPPAANLNPSQVHEMKSPKVIPVFAQGHSHNLTCGHSHSSSHRTNTWKDAGVFAFHPANRTRFCHVEHLMSRYSCTVLGV